MKIAVLTLGCKTNQAESMQIEIALNDAGHQMVDLSEDPEMCIINTCAVTSRADSQSRQLIDKALRANSNVIVTGCYAELNSERLERKNNKVRVIKNTEKSNIINLFSGDTLINKRTIMDSYSSTKKSGHPSVSARHRPIVKVQDGCNYSCSYCAIPAARGRSKSISESDIINEIKLYESMGYKEIVLTGIHLGTYGLDLKPKKSLSVLLRNILINTKISRIRLSSLEINEMSDELVELFGEYRMCKHLHIPLQSGDDNILRLMNRNYSVNDFTSGIERIIKKVPGIAIGTDIITGFPGEGDIEFANTMSLVEFLDFSYLHVFPYSPRPNTKALMLNGRVKGDVIKKRAALLRDVGMAKKEDYIRRYIGKTLDIIVEERGREWLIGTAGNYIKVLCTEKNNSIHEGMLVNVKIVGYKNYIALGSPENI